MIVKGMKPISSEFSFSPPKFVEHADIMSNDKHHISVYHYFRTCYCFILILTHDEEMLIISKDNNDKTEFNRLFMKALEDFNNSNVKEMVKNVDGYDDFREKIKKPNDSNEDVTSSY